MLLISVKSCRFQYHPAILGTQQESKDNQDEVLQG